MSSEKDAKLKALKLTLDKLDKTYGKGTVMKMSDQAVVDVDAVAIEAVAAAGASFEAPQLLEEGDASSVVVEAATASDTADGTPETGLMGCV